MKQRSVRLTLTGFGSFPGVPANPTEVLVSDLSWLGEGSAAAALKCGSSMVLPVNTVDVDAGLDDLHSSNRKHESDFHTLYIHLGVNASATVPNLEMEGVNNATFRCPDTRGYEPTDAAVDSGDPLNYERFTRLPLESIVKNVGLGTLLSHDAGRYICNYTYYKSLKYTQTVGGAGDSLFIHIPPFEVLSQPVVSASLATILNYIVDVTAASVALPSPSPPLPSNFHLVSEIRRNLVDLGFTAAQVNFAVNFPDVFTVEKAVEKVFLMGGEGEDDDEEEEEERGTAPEEYKMVLCARNDLKMGKGKLAAQCCHACLGAYRVGMETSPSFAREVEMWEVMGEAKVVLRVESEEEIVQLQKEATALGIINYLVQDAGRTQIVAGSLTVLAVGPAPISLINKVTGKLKLM